MWETIAIMIVGILGYHIAQHIFPELFGNKKDKD